MRKSLGAVSDYGDRTVVDATHRFSCAKVSKMDEKMEIAIEQERVSMVEMFKKERRVSDMGDTRL